MYPIPGCRIKKAPRPTYTLPRFSDFFCVALSCFVLALLSFLNSKLPPTTFARHIKLFFVQIFNQLKQSKYVYI